MKQKVQLVAYFGAFALAAPAFAAVYEDMAAACAAYDAVKAALPGANVAFIGQDFDAALAAIAGKEA